MTYADVPQEWSKWSRITCYTDTGQVTWAFGWWGRCWASGKAGSEEHARRQMDRAAGRVLDELKRRCRK